MTTINNSTVAKAKMLIHRPVSEVFEAFINPEITTKFWFTKSTGKLASGKHVEWTWEMYDATVSVFVKSIEANKTIIIEWGNYQEKTTVEWTFKQLDNNSTFVTIVNSGFIGDTEQVISQIRDSTEGFTLVLAGLKAYLEHNIQLNLVADHTMETGNKSTKLKGKYIQKITPFLWFDGKAEDAMNFYISIFKNSKILSITRYGEEGP